MIKMCDDSDNKMKNEKDIYAKNIKERHTDVETRANLKEIENWQLP